MHEYTETESKYTGKMGHIACGNKCRKYFEVKKLCQAK